MADAVFDGANLHVTLPSIGTFDVETNLYSAWKEWIALSDNAKYPPAFDTTGGDNVGGGQEIAPYFFCRNDLGWRIKMPEDDGEIVVSGNLFPRDPTTVLFEQTTGYDAFLRLEVSTRAVSINDLSSSDVSSAVWGESLESGFTAKQLMQLQAAAMAGKIIVSGDTVTIRDVNDTSDRIVATTDEQGQRTAVTHTVS